MTAQDIITGLLDREGGFVDHPADNGGPTNFGITAQTWGLENHWGRQATRAEVQAITRSQAEAFYRRRHVLESPFREIADEALRVQLIDFGVNSGTARATRWLQRAIGVPVTGILDAATRAVLDTAPPRLVNNALVAARCKMVDDWTDGDATQKTFEEGVESRALAFFQG